MKYITGMFALNIPCSLLTCGDWHTSTMQWANVHKRESAESVFGDWGIEQIGGFEPLPGTHYFANTLRAIADLISDGNFWCAQGARDGFIDNPSYHDELFEHIWMLKKAPNWEAIDAFMLKEFKREWYSWKLGKSGTGKRFYRCYRP